ncbi:MAG TPA: carboxypeptidase regulatory-like domain-containing protein [Gemmatimonadales bacterium]|nr:carboxypeptidase regulatory-like domain-containing protein [Gemmatimonadales bacterium]
MNFEYRIWLAAIGLGLSLGTIPGELGAQSLTSGSLRGTVQTADGVPISGAAVTIESRGGRAMASLTTDRSGGFRTQLLLPGEFRILVEQIGFQPVRTTGVVITPGNTTSLAISLERKPPPITSVTEISNAGARAGGAARVLLSGSALSAFDRPAELTGVGRMAPVVVAPGDARTGLGLGANGLDISQTRLFVDGVMETLLRHPGLRAEPPTTPVFSRQALDQVQFLGPASDLEWRGGPGSLVSAQSRSGGGRFSLAPYATFSSAKLGQNKLDNPGDSSATSFQVGAVLSGSIVPDTAHLLVEGGYESLQQPTAAPWSNDSLGSLLTSIGHDNFNTALARFVAPSVRSWKGGHGLARLDWRLGARNQLAARLGFASWKETNPLLGADLFAGTGSSLKARDLSGSAAVTTTGEIIANEFRFGLSMARREWQSDGPVGTILSGEGIAFGTAPALPATFDVKRVDLSDAVQYSLGAHRLKGGLSLNLTSYQQDYRFGSRGLFLFGAAADFASGTGTFFQVTGPAESPRFSVTAPGIFLQDTWTAAPDIQLQAGLRYDTQIFPARKIAADTAWLSASGIPNDSLPKYRKRISPRASFLWDVQNRGQWIVRGSGGLYPGELDPALFAEAILFDGGATVRRGQGGFPSWPAADASVAPAVGKRLTLFSATTRSPRTAKFDVGLAHGIRGGTTFSISGSYGHTDFLLRRSDLNRPDAGSSATQEGRPLFGTLVKQGALVTVAPGSNRKFNNFDLVSGLAPTGFVDHYEVTASLEHQVSRGLSLEASYTYGKTTDNLLGLLQPDPADQLDPFPTGIPGGGDWSSGRSDLDVPHRVAASAHYRSAGKTPLEIGARWRWRSGLPFTPGFRPGVDLNGDFGGNNDPVLVDQGLESALGAKGCSVVAGDFAARNSCRESSVQALDLRLSVGLPLRIGSGGSLSLTVDGFNVVSSKTGVVDRAALLIDPAGSLTTGSNGRVTVPFLSNPNFGSLLSRRVDPRVIRFGLRMEY